MLATWLMAISCRFNNQIASILNENRIIFNIKGNSYRLIAKINYEYQMVWIRFIGTHAEYDKINANTI